MTTVFILTSCVTTDLDAESALSTGSVFKTLDGAKEAAQSDSSAYDDDDYTAPELEWQDASALAGISAQNDDTDTIYLIREVPLLD